MAWDSNSFDQHLNDFIGTDDDGANGFSIKDATLPDDAVLASAEANAGLSSSFDDAFCALSSPEAGLSPGAQIAASELKPAPSNFDRHDGAQIAPSDMGFAKTQRQPESAAASFESLKSKFLSDSGEKENEPAQASPAASGAAEPSSDDIPSSDWSSAKPQDAPATNAHDHGEKPKTDVATNAHDHGEKPKTDVATNAHDHGGGAPVESFVVRPTESKSFGDKSDAPGGWANQNDKSNDGASGADGGIHENRLHVRSYGDADVHGKLRNTFVMQVLIVIGPIGLGIFFFLSGYVELLFLLTVLAMIVLPVVFVFIGKMRSKILKEIIVRDELKRHFTDIKYRTDIFMINESVESREIDYYNIIDRSFWTDGFISDEITACYGDDAMSFKFMDLVINHTTTGSKGKKRVRKLYGGQLFAFDLPFSVPRPIRLHTRSVMVSRSEIAEMASLGVDERLVERYELVIGDAVVASSWQPEFEIGPDTFKKLFETVDAIHNLSLGAVRLHMFGDKMYFSIARDANPFEVRSLDAFTNVADIRSRVASEVRELASIIDTLAKAVR